jgi:hypothetical protein
VSTRPSAGVSMRRRVLHIDDVHGQVIIAYRPDPGDASAAAALAGLAEL